MKPQEIVTEHKLTLPEVLGMLVIDGMVSQSAADALLADQRLRRHTGHPFTIISAQNWKSQQTPNHVLNADTLAEWMAKRTGLEYFHIDPLKIDFTGLTDIMSNEYAARFGILPVQLTKTEVVIATSEPFLRDWESVIRQLTRREVRRVISAPEDINRYLVEFFNLARSVKKAAQSKHQEKSGQASFEQLVEMGKGNKQLDANDQHIVHIVDWLWQYAFEQRASDIHIEPRRDIGIVRFRIDGVLHQVYQIPMPVMTAMTSRIKLLGRMDVVEKRRPQDGRI
jgi:general secretion pathway protein E